MVDPISENFDLHARLAPGQAKGMKVFHSRGLCYVDSGLACDSFNIIHISNGREVSEKDLEDAIDYYRSRKVSYCIWLSHENLTKKIKKIFQKLSVTEMNRDPAMTLNLLDYVPLANELHKNITVATNREEIADYAAVIAAGLTNPDPNIMAYYRQTSDCYLDPANKIILAIYYHEGKPVSTMEIFPSGNNTIGLYSLSTLEDYRGRGIGSALMSFSLNKSKELGYTTAVLEASADGYNIYQRFGFKVKTQYYEFA